MSHKEQKEELLAHTAAEFVNFESNRESLITVTRAALSTDEKQATIYISVLPESYEQHALDFLKRKRPELRTYVKKKTRVRVIPFFDFEIDYGEKNRQDIDTLSIRD
ncbi:MAG: hypothetical protein AMXMBFR44_5990 [Candidatus Campbellbacteria bacterium]